MKIDEIRDDTKTETGFLLTVADRELRALPEPSVIVPMIQARLAMAIVDKIMEKIGPELDKILGDKK